MLLKKDSVVKLSFNENPYGPSPKAVEAIVAAACQSHLYHDIEAKDLRRKIANHYQLKMENVYVSNGGDEAITLLVNAFVSPGDEILMPCPTFGQYAIAATIMDGVPIRIPLRQDNFAADLTAMLAAITARTKIIFLCNPNNPTGVSVDGVELRRFLSAVPPNVLVGLDEAYGEYVTDPCFESGISLLTDFPNVVVLRTFSKIYGLAGLRVGYGIASQEIIDWVQRIRPIFNVNNLAQFGAMAALDDLEFILQVKSSNEAERRYLTSRLSGFGWRVIPSHTNFLFADTGREASLIADAVREAGIIIRDGRGWGYPTFLRISLGTHLQNEALATVLKKFCPL